MPENKPGPLKGIKPRPPGTASEELHCRIAPATKEALEIRRKQLGMSFGNIIDLLVFSAESNAAISK